MMTGPVLLTALWIFRPTLAFTPRLFSSSRISTHLYSSTALAERCISRLGTLQTLLSRHGAPGSKGCSQIDDLEAVLAFQDVPELVSRLSAGSQNPELANLHPYLYPIAKSQATGNFICAYRNPLVEESDQNHPWPIVETKLGAPGMHLLALNSELLMRRIVCECDFAGTDNDLIQLYNEGLGKGFIQDHAMDAPYQLGSVEKLGYGVDKFVLLRVGPFADLYENMAKQHASKGDEQSSLIAAEAANIKLSGFGSTFRFYARLLQSFPNREEESRDAARMCLRLPLPTIGMELEDFKEVAVLGRMSTELDSIEVALNSLKSMFEKMKELEKEDDPNQGKTPEQVVIDEAAQIIDIAALERRDWSSIRPQLGERFRAIGREDMANFVDTLGVLQ